MLQITLAWAAGSEGGQVLERFPVPVVGGVMDPQLLGKQDRFPVPRFMHQAQLSWTVTMPGPVLSGPDGGKFYI